MPPGQLQPSATLQGATADLQILYYRFSVSVIDLDGAPDLKYQPIGQFALTPPLHISLKSVRISPKALSFGTGRRRSHRVVEAVDLWFSEGCPCR